MKRRDFLKAGGFAAVLPFCDGVFAANRKQPNLLIIQTDEHNFRTLGCYRALMPKDQALMWGDAVVETPNIDWLAQNGAICTSFYATTPVCSPSRAAFISGRYPQNTPVVTNDIPLNDDIVSFAEILRRAAYATGYSGKWHLDGKGKPQWAPKRQFGFTDNRYMFNRGHWKQFEDTAAGARIKARNAAGNASYDVKGANEKSFATDWLTDKTIEFVTEHQTEPFCYMVSLPDPHGPDTVRAPYDTMYKNQTYKEPRTFSKATDNLPTWAKPADKFNGMALYYGMVKCIDDNVGRILKTLRTTGLIDNTIVIFTADHGDLRGEHHRQNKGVPFEGSAKVPFVMYYPDKVKASTVITESLGCVDFLPTICSLMNQRTAGTEQGRDASELFVKGKAPSSWTDITFIRGTGGQNGQMSWLAAITKRYKLIYSANDDPWLFDLQKDPDELANYFTDKSYRRIVRTMSQQVLEYGNKYKDPYITSPRVAADLKWAITGKGEYASNQPGEQPASVKARRPKTNKNR